MSIGNIKTVTFKINLYAQWISEYGYNRDTVAVSSHTPSGNINAVPEIIKLMCPWLSQKTHPVAILT